MKKQEVYNFLVSMTKNMTEDQLNNISKKFKGKSLVKDYLQTIIDEYNVKLNEAIYMILHNMDKPKECPDCGKKCRFITFLKGYTEYCGDCGLRHSGLKTAEIMRNKTEEERQESYRKGQETIRKNRLEKQHDDSWKLLDRNDIKEYVLDYLRGDENRIRGIGNHLYHKRYDIYQYLEQEQLKFGYDNNSTILYMILNDIEEPPKCKTCNTNYCSFHFDSKTGEKKFSDYCTHCGFIQGGINSNETFKSTHNGLGVFQIPEYREKGMIKLLNTTGYAHPTQNPETMKKIIQTYTENNGGMGFASKSVLEKINNIMNREHGCGIWEYSSTKECQDKIESNSLKTHGVTRWMKLDSSKELFHNMNVTPKTIQKVKNYLNQYDLDLISEYYNSMTPIKVKCRNCGYEFYFSNYNQLQQGMLYPYCKNCKPLECKSISTPEITIRKQLLELYPDIDIRSSIRTILEDNKELDIYLPDKNLAIEYCGLWCHSSNVSKKHETIDPKPSTYHYNKYKQCKDKGIQLLTIFETETIDSIINRVIDIIDKDQVIDINSLEKYTIDNNDYYLIDNRYNDYEFYSNKDEFELIDIIEPKEWFWESRDHDFIRTDKFKECYCSDGENPFAIANENDYNWLYDCGYQVIKPK